VLEPDEGKLSSPVLRGLGASNGARPLGKLRRSVGHTTAYSGNSGPRSSFGPTFISLIETCRDRDA
jgi:hypothetical protein